MSQRCWEAEKRYFGDGPIKNTPDPWLKPVMRCRFCHDRGIHKVARWWCPQADLVGEVDPNDIRIDWVPTCEECAEGWWDGATWGPIPFREVE